MGGSHQNGNGAVSTDMNHPDNVVSFSNKKGCYISRFAAFMYFVMFVCAVVATGLLVYYYLPQVKSVVEDIKATLGTTSVNTDNDREESSESVDIPTTTMKMLTKDPASPEAEKHPPETSSNADEDHIHTEPAPPTAAPPAVAPPAAAPPDAAPSTVAPPAAAPPATAPSTVSPSSEPAGIPKWSRRLPRSLKAVHYGVKLQPFIYGNFSINGFVEVKLEVLEPTTNITLHMADIITHNDTILLQLLDGPIHTGPHVPIRKHEFDPEREFYIAHLNEPLEVGRLYMLSMDFTGYLNDNLRGFYRSTYRDDDGTQKWLATTQFQASDARRAFPCFDEPGFKANFEISLGRLDTMNSLSNMPLAESVPMADQPGWVWDHYEPTELMSTYLIAFAISDFTSMNVTYDDWMFRVWARESAIDQAEYALTIGSNMLAHFEHYYNISFPLPKLDMIALPDFAYGAMENWGLVTFRETLMLYDPITSSAYNKQLIASVTGHELAHQWFGNLVTPQWWTDIWLNEGFASYAEYIGVDHVEPTFHIMEQFVLKRIHGIFHKDSLESSHPIRHDAENADMIAYDKGSSLIRMMNHFLTEDTFTKGLNNYLRVFQYANAETDDLWHYLSLAALEDGTLPTGLTVKMIMDTWTLQMGYPVITVVRSPEGSSATVSQERFLLWKKHGSTDNHDYKWWVPLSYTGEITPNFTTTRPMVWMKPSESAITIEGLPLGDHWVVFNIQQTGFYRVNYDSNNWFLIANQLKENHTVISTINRAQIIDDSINLASAGHLAYSTPLSLFKYLIAEEEYVPWAAALNNLSYLRKMLRPTVAYGALKNYLLSLVIPLYESVGFEDNSEEDYQPLQHQYKRSNGLAWACVLQHEDCLNKSVDLYRKWMGDTHNSSIISPNLKSMVYCRAIQEGNKAEWDFAWQQYMQSNVAAEKEKLLSAMGCSKDTAVLSKYLDMAFTPDSGIRKQDIRRVFGAVASNPVGTPLAWRMLQEQWDRVHSFYEHIIIDLIKSTSRNFNTKQQLDELQTFIVDIESHFPERVQDIIELLETVRVNVQWMETYYDVIVQWLQENGFSSGQ